MIAVRARAFAHRIAYAGHVARAASLLHSLDLAVARLCVVGLAARAAARLLAARARASASRTASLTRAVG